MNKDKTIGDIYKSTLYLVPTPIGNLGDITYRAINILNKVDFILAEDTRHTGLLLKYFNINTRLLSFHDHSKQKKIDIILSNLQKGLNAALVSDSGTPLINDPGYHLIYQCHKLNLNVIPLPGACAAITALSASGLPTNRFCYEGFLPKKRKLRFDHLKGLTYEPRTLIFYESKHRLLGTLEDMLLAWGPERYIVLARELTKMWESIYRAQINKLILWLKQSKIKKLGEITLIVKGFNINNESISLKTINTLFLLMKELPFNKSINLTAKIYNIKKNSLYKHFLNQKLKN